MKRTVILIIALIAIAAAIIALESLHPTHASAPMGDNEVATSTVHTANYAELAAQFPPAQELVHPDGYINASSTLTLSSLVGKKVILLDFWTYSCINCQRTLPYLEAWYDKYKDYGLEIVGVHTPEFDFEKVLSNVEAAVKKFGITYPVVLDSEYGTWDAYANEYWPEHYLIDINGLVVDRGIGEGDYAGTEMKIQELLKERAQALGEDPPKIPTGLVGVNAAEIDAQSPETYFGSERNEFLGNGAQGKQGAQTLSAPAAVSPDTLYLSGAWDFLPQYAQAAAGDHIIYSYDAKDVYFVASASSTADVEVLRDGAPVGALRGDDVDQNGVAHIEGARLYHLVKEQAPGRHTLELIIKSPGLEAFTFTFG